jgi:short-subunit dehydrogenase
VTQPATLVTGASSGLGAAFARACARRGEELVLAARRRDRLDLLAQELGERVHVIGADLSEAGAAARLLAQVEALGLHVKTLINNAGDGLTGPFADLPLDRQRAMIDLNVTALVELTHAVLPGMRARRSGGILNVASTGAFQAGPRIAIYFATKAFVLSFTEALHQELKGTGIRVTALCPGPTETEFGALAGFKRKPLKPFVGAPGPVVRAGLRGLGRNQAVVIPGVINKVTAQSNRVIPRAVMRRIAAALKL